METNVPYKQKLKIIVLGGCVFKLVVMCFRITFAFLEEVIVTTSCWLKESGHSLPKSLKECYPVSMFQMICMENMVNLENTVQNIHGQFSCNIKYLKTNIIDTKAKNVAHSSTDQHIILC